MMGTLPGLCRAGILLLAFSLAILLGACGSQKSKAEKAVTSELTNKLGSFPAQGGMLFDHVETTITDVGSSGNFTGTSKVFMKATEDLYVPCSEGKPFNALKYFEEATGTKLSVIDPEGMDAATSDEFEGKIARSLLAAGGRSPVYVRLIRKGEISALFEIPVSGRMEGKAATIAPSRFTPIGGTEPVPKSELRAGAQVCASEAEGREFRNKIAKEAVDRVVAEFKSRTQPAQ